MFLLRLIAFVHSSTNWISSRLKRAPSCAQGKSSVPLRHLPYMHPSKGSNAHSSPMFLVNHPYEGRFFAVNLINTRTGLSLLYELDTAKEVTTLVAAALRGDPVDIPPTAIITSQKLPRHIPRTWD